MNRIEETNGSGERLTKLRAIGPCEICLHDHVLYKLEKLSGAPLTIKACLACLLYAAVKLIGAIMAGSGRYSPTP